ncbi:hypothetical protein IBE33_09300 [Francisella philomiragia]|uniref:hypothetical protein n=1 Tax=Francisella philomiragia TaxID=28110 RepID=UPI001907F4FA|nr:hypothetical protein [Francisella philomiragia]MBK2341705.1 hypothetical protein [Francisella philomiragia]
MLIRIIRYFFKTQEILTYNQRIENERKEKIRQQVQSLINFDVVNNNNIYIPNRNIHHTLEKDMLTVYKLLDDIGDAIKSNSNDSELTQSFSKIISREEELKEFEIAKVNAIFSSKSDLDAVEKIEDLCVNCDKYPIKDEGEYLLELKSLQDRFNNREFPRNILQLEFFSDDDVYSYAGDDGSHRFALLYEYCKRNSPHQRVMFNIATCAINFNQVQKLREKYSIFIFDKKHELYKLLSSAEVKNDSYPNIKIFVINNRTTNNSKNFKMLDSDYEIYNMCIIVVPNEYNVFSENLIRLGYFSLLDQILDMCI